MGASPHTRLLPVAASLLLFAGSLLAQELRPGFDRDEYAGLMAVSA